MTPKFAAAWSRYLYLLTVVSLFSIGGLLRAEDVSREVPAFYTEKVEPLLTPLATVLEKKDVFSAEDAEGATLLNEQIDFVDEKGRSFMVEHNIYRAFTESSCESVAKDTYSFRRGREKIHLLLARTILPDGREIPVQPNAVFIKSPQDRADSALYDDEGELIIIYPNITPGAITESIVVYEEEESRIPGEFTRLYSWRSGWPKVAIHRVVDLPNSLAERLRLTATGANVPAPEKTHPTPDRTRYTWTVSNQKALRSESGMPPTAQSGPATWLTTLSGWDVFARWYGGLLEGRSTLTPALKAQVDEWTKDAKDNRQIMEILTERVSRDVRYVGLEFGIAGYQPADCNDVWANRYGDCKDKANLLRAMLAYKNVPAHLVLLNTEHAGQLEKRSPDHRLFDHMILVVEPEPGQRVFCDPTIQYGKAGVIPPSDADRDVFVLDGEKSGWSRTPPAEGGDLFYQFDLKRDAQGDVSGWLTFRATGYYAAYYAADYAGQDRDDTLRSVGDLVRAFFNSAEVVDVEKMPTQVEDGSFQFKTYFVLPSGTQSASAVSMPFYSGLLPDVGSDAKRLTPYFLWRDNISVKMNLDLPPSLEAVTVPKPYQVNSSALEASAAWATEKSGISSTLTIKVKDSLVDVDEYPVLRNAGRSLRSWLSQPLLLGERTGDGKVVEPTASQTPTEITLENFPMMPTAEGQRDLLDKRFGPDSDLNLRKKAFQTILQYFPNDKTTVYYARMYLALMRYDEGEKAEAVEQVRQLVADYRASLEINWSEWGDYRLAYLYLDEKKKDLALPLFLKVAKDSKGSDFRRGWSYFRAAEILAPTAPDEAIDLLRKGIELNTDAQRYQLPLLVKLLIDKGELDQAAEAIAKMEAKNNEDSDKAIADLSKSTQDWNREQKEKLITVLERSGVAKSGPLAEELTKMRSRLQWGEFSSRLQTKLKDYLKAHPRAGFTRAKGTTIPEILKEIDAAEEEKQSDKSIDLTLQILTEFPPNDDFPEHLWRASTRADWHERVNGEGSTAQLLPYLLDLCDELPKDNDNYFEGKVTRSEVLNRAEKYAETEVLLKALLAEPGFDLSYEASVRRELGLAQEKQGKYEDALSNYLKMRPKIGDYSGISNLMLRAVFIDLHLGREDHAIGLLQQLAKVPANVAKKSVYAAQIANFTRLAADPEKAKAYWKAASAWRGEWERLFARMVGDRAEPAFVVVPVIEDLVEVGTEIGNAVRIRDRKVVARNCRLIVSAARWEPDMAVEMGTLRYSLAPFFSDSTTEFVSFTAAILTPVSDLDTNVNRRRVVMLADAYTSLKEPKKAMEALRPFLKEEQRDEINAAFRRVWSIAAFSLKDEQAPALAAMEETLGLPDATSDRGLTVRLAALLYAEAGRKDEQKALLTRELENARVKSSEQYEGLKAMLASLGGDDAEAKSFAQFLEAWLAKFKPSWYDYAQPASVDDSKFKSMQAVVDERSDLPRANVIKFRLLQAQDPAQDYYTRLNGWDVAAREMLRNIIFVKEAQAFYDYLLKNKDLTEQTRRRWLLFAMADMTSQHNVKLFEEYQKDPLIEGISSDEKDLVNIWELRVREDITSAESLGKVFTKLSEGPITERIEYHLWEVYQATLRLGALDVAQQMYDQVAKWPLAEDFSTSNSALSLKYLKELKLARKWVPVQQKLREVALKYFPEKDIKRPANYSDLMSPLDDEQLQVDNATDIRLYRIAQKQIDPKDLRFWTLFVRGLDINPKRSEFRTALARALVEAAEGDGEKVIAVSAAINMLDTDDEAEWAALRAMMAPYENADKWPLTSVVVKNRLPRQALRTGSVAEVDAAIAKFSAESSNADDQRLVIPYLLAKQKMSEAKAILENMPPEELLAPIYMGGSAKALNAVGLSDELELLKESARKEIYLAIVDSWMLPSSYQISEALEMAEALDDPSVLPQGWQTDLLAVIREKTLREKLKMEPAVLEKNWPVVAEASERAIELSPTYYHLYWIRGLALYHLGRKKEALDALKTYAKYCGDESNYPQAVQLIKELEGAETALNR